MMSFRVLGLLSVLLLSGCSLSPLSGGQYSSAIDFYMIVPHMTESNDELYVQWEGAHVDSNGNILSWEPLTFITRANSSAPFTLFNGESYRSYSANAPFYNWTNANTGYTGGCGNLPKSCPEHGLIRATIRYPGGTIPAYVFNQTGLQCAVSQNNGRNVITNCAIDDADGIVVVFSEN